MIVPNLQEFYLLFKVTNNPIMSIDYGTKKLGIAISDPQHQIAMPLQIINAISIQDQIHHILALIKQYSISGIVIGVPINMDGTQGVAAQNIESFAQKLSSVTQLPLYLQDERMTSMHANSILKSLEIKRKKRNKMDDALSASLNLETVLSRIKAMITATSIAKCEELKCNFNTTMSQDDH